VTLFDQVLAAVPKTQAGPKCTVGVLIKSLEPDEAASLKKAISTSGIQRIPSSTIATAIKSAYGVSFGREALDRHRRGLCKCEEDAR
jgi:hypothetical protein